MTQRTVPAAETFAKWRKDPEYVAAYGALEQASARMSSSCELATGNGFRLIRLLRSLRLRREALYLIRWISPTPGGRKLGHERAT
jgi:hypothetical protein